MIFSFQLMKGRYRASKVLEYTGVFVRDILAFYEAPSHVMGPTSAFHFLMRLVLYLPCHKCTTRGPDFICQDEPARTIADPVQQLHHFALLCMSSISQLQQREISHSRRRFYLGINSALGRQHQCREDKPRAGIGSQNVDVGRELRDSVGRDGAPGQRWRRGREVYKVNRRRSDELRRSWGPLLERDPAAEV